MIGSKTIDNQSLTMATNWEHLPEHLQDHIKSFIPKTFMNNILQQDIKTAAALVKIRRMENEWHDLCNSPDEYTFTNRGSIFGDLPINAEEFDDDHIADSLVNCGCCKRHSGFARSTKLFTINKCFVSKIGLENKLELPCSCSCRHHRRMLNGFSF